MFFKKNLKEERSIRSGKLSGKTLWHSILTLSFPILVGQLLVAFVGLFDKVLAGQMPEEDVIYALDGLGVGSYIGWFIALAMAGVGIGGQALIARSIGKGHSRSSSRILGQSITLGVFWGTLVAIIVIILAPLLGSVSQLSNEASSYCTTYVRYMGTGVPFAAIMMVGSMAMYGAGETLKPTIIAMGVNIVNIIFSWILSGVDLNLLGYVITNPFNINLGIGGIALGTSVSYFAGGLATFFVLASGIKGLKLELSYEIATTHSLFPRIYWFKRIGRIGIPNFFEGVAMWSCNLFILRFIGLAEGPEGKVENGLQGAHIIAVQWEAFSFLPGFALGTAAGTLAGQYLGAGSKVMAARAVLLCTFIAAVIMQSIGILFVFFGEFFTEIITSEEVFMKQVPPILVLAGWTQSFFAISMVVRQGLRGAGDTLWTFLITAGSSYLIRLPLCWFIGVFLGFGLWGIWVGLCAELGVRALLFVFRFIHGGWTEAKV